MRDHLSGGTVHGCRAGRGQTVKILPHAHHAGNTQGAGQNYGVRGRGTIFGEEPRHLRLVQLDRLAGQQVGGCHDHWMVYLHDRVPHPLEDADEPPGHVPHVGSPGLHILVPLHGLEHRRQAVSCLLDRPLGAGSLVQRAGYPLIEVRIV